MEKKFKFGVIGAGYMASSIIMGALNSGFLEKSQIIVNDVNPENEMKFANIGVAVSKSSQYIYDNADFVLLSIKPQNFYSQTFFGSLNDLKVISIMAGVKKEKIAKKFPNAQIVRCMPNAPCAVNSGVVGADLSELTKEEDKIFVNALFSAVSTLVEVDESMLGVVTGISGSAPAYFYLFAKGLIDVGMKNGLSYEQSKKFVVNTMIGSGKMLLEKDEDISSLISSVCSKGGTTIEAINIYNQNNLTNISELAVDACIKRSNELENL